MKRHSTTPWKKSRTYGDIFGGRMRRRMADNIFARAHSLRRPDEGRELPVLIEDNPSRDYLFPVKAAEFAAALQRFPDSCRQGITHIWLRRTPARTAASDRCLAEFICGSGVRLIVIYPWRTDGRLDLGRRKPAASVVAQYGRFGASLLQEDGSWYVHMSEFQLRRFYIEHLFCHEVGHHVDRYHRRWSKANTRRIEEFANQYAVLWGRDISACLIHV